MSDRESPSEEPPVRNELSGSVTGHSVQVGVVHGDITVGRPARWLRPVAFIAAVLLPVTVLVVLVWQGNSPTASVPGGGEPFTIAIARDANICSQWVVPRPPAALDLSLPIPRQWPEWEQAKDGVAGSGGGVLLTVQGRSEAQVVLTGLTIRVLARRSPFSGTTLVGGVRECGDLGALRGVDVDLDVEPPKAAPWTLGFPPNPGIKDWELKPIKFPYRVSLTDAETFLISASTEKCDCDWAAELSWVSQGQTGTTVIDDHGKPFRTTSTVGTVHCQPAGTNLDDQTHCG